MQVQSLSWEDPLEEFMATHSSVLAQRIPWTEEPGRLQSMGCTELDTTEVTEQQQAPLQQVYIIIYLSSQKLRSPPR